MKKLSLYIFLVLMVCGQTFADDQAERKKLIDSLINKNSIFEKIEIPGLVPRVWVTPKFHLLTFSEKKLLFILSIHTIILKTLIIKRF